MHVKHVFLHIVLLLFFSALVGFSLFSLFHYNWIVFYVYVGSCMSGCLGACAGMRVCVYEYVLYVCVCI